MGKITSKINGAIKSVFNYAAQNAEDTFSGLWFESMDPVSKLMNNAAGLAGIGLLLNASSGVEIAFGSLLLASTASQFRMAGRAQRLGKPSGPQPG